MPSPSYHPNWHVRCISAPGPDTDLSLFISFDNARFLFGCGEGTQRAFVQKKLSMKGLNGILIGSGSSRGRNGLAGVLLTASDAGISNMDIIGPPDITHYLATTRSSVVRDSLKVNMFPYPVDSTNEAEIVYETQNITVRAIALRGSIDDQSIPSTKGKSDPSPKEPTVNDVPQSTSEPGREPLPVDPSSSSDILNLDEAEGASEEAAQPPLSESAKPSSPPIPIPYYLKTGFRPTLLSRPALQRWCTDLVADMFPGGRRPRHPYVVSPSDPAYRFTNPSGELRPARAIASHPLPIPSAQDAKTDMVYILQAPPVRGKFDVKKATELKVPSGPLRGKLVKGESVEVVDESAPDGKRLVKPEDCLVGGGPGGILIVVTCSSENLESLLSSPAFFSYQPARLVSAETTFSHVHLVVHRVPSVVWRDRRYRDWMAAFGETTQHLIADPDDYRNDVYFSSSARNLLHLSMIDKDMFPVPFNVGGKRFEALDLPPNTDMIQPNHIVKMYPPSEAEIIPFHDGDRPLNGDGEATITVIKEIKTEMPQYVEEARKARVTMGRSKSEKRSKQPGDDIVVTTLGTGSAVPSKYRNVSSTHLDMPGFGGVLLDAGEGTLGQLRRRYGPEGVREIYSNLKMIFISHMHADHHLGLQSILEDRFKHGFTSKLYLVAPEAIALSLIESAPWQLAASEEALDNLEFIDVYVLRGKASRMSDNKQPLASENGDSNHDRSRVPISLLDHEAAEDHFNGTRRWPGKNIIFSGEASSTTYWAAQRSKRELVEDLNLESIITPLVTHRGKAFGLVMEHISGWKIVYSGDTTPCGSLIQAGQNATLLIHEATLEDDKTEMAALKGHSTFSQAIEVGTKMKARHILLNHFSQRYPKLPKLPEPTATEDGVTAPVVTVSFDLMSVPVKDMWKMAHYMDAISLLFKDDLDTAEEESINLDHNVESPTKAETMEKKTAKVRPTILEKKIKGSKKAVKVGIVPDKEKSITVAAMQKTLAESSKDSDQDASSTSSGPDKKAEEVAPGQPEKDSSIASPPFSMDGPDGKPLTADEAKAVISAMVTRVSKSQTPPPTPKTEKSKPASTPSSKPTPPSTRTPFGVKTSTTSTPGDADLTLIESSSIQTSEGEVSASPVASMKRGLEPFISKRSQRRKLRQAEEAVKAAGASDLGNKELEMTANPEPNGTEVHQPEGEATEVETERQDEKAAVIPSATIAEGVSAQAEDVVMSESIKEL